MSGSASRLQRILRVRAVEHRIVQMRLAEAEKRHTTLLQIGSRIDALRARVNPGSGAINGASLKAMGEMAGRLETARADMANPVAAAESERKASEILRGAAWAREEGASRLHQKAASREAASAELRADANRPHRPKDTFLSKRNAQS